MLVNQNTHTYQRVPIFVVEVQILCSCVKSGSWRVSHCGLESKHASMQHTLNTSVLVHGNLKNRETNIMEANSDENILHYLPKHLGFSARLSVKYCTSLNRRMNQQKPFHTSILSHESHENLFKPYLFIYPKDPSILTATLNIDTRTVLVVAAKHQRVVDINNHLSSTSSP
jgi:hypothetical protein